jgi:hypothetical protein
MKAWFAAQWAKLRPGLIAAGGLILGILALIGIAKIRQGGAAKPSGVKSLGVGGSDLPMPQGGTAADEKAKEAAVESTMARNPNDVLHDLDADTRARIDAAKRAGVQAGIDAARKAVHPG